MTYDDFPIEAASHKAAVVTLLRSAAAHITPENWTKGARWLDANGRPTSIPEQVTQCCAQGRIDLELETFGACSGDTDTETQQLGLGARLACERVAGVPLFYFNDATRRTVGEVVALFTTTADLLEATR